MKCKSPASSQPCVLGLFAFTIILGLLFYVFGVPLVSSQGLFIRSTFFSGKLPFNPKSPKWERAVSVIVSLSGQVITPPTHPKPSIASMTVRTLHNGKEIVFLVEWEDPTKNDRLLPGKFRDAVALAFPLGDAPPFFCMGQVDNYVNIWHWKADWQADLDRWKEEKKKYDGVTRGHTLELQARRASSVEDLLGGGFNTLTSKRGQGIVQGDAVWERGRWKVVFKRALETRDPDDDAIFGPNLVQTIAFAVWNGETKERGGLKAVAPWLQLVLDPVP
jgi:hypothetical protein